MTVCTYSMYACTVGARRDLVRRRAPVLDSATRGRPAPHTMGVAGMVAGIGSQGAQLTVDELWRHLSAIRAEGGGARPVALGGVDHPLRPVRAVEVVSTRWTVYGERDDGTPTEVVLLR